MSYAPRLWAYASAAGDKALIRHTCPDRETRHIGSASQMPPVYGHGMSNRHRPRVLASVAMVLLGRARTSKLARRLEHSFSFYAHQEFGPDWTGSGSRAAWLDRDVWASSTFHVDRWQGVRVNDSAAQVLVRGDHRGTSRGGTPKRDNWAQYKLNLHRDPTAPDGWRIVHEQAASIAA